MTSEIEKLLKDESVARGSRNVRGVMSFEKFCSLLPAESGYGTYSNSVTSTVRVSPRTLWSWPKERASETSD